MGSSLRQSENEQEVDCSRQSFPHKCTGTERSLPICTSSSEEPESQNSQFEHGQLNGCRLHQPQRGNPFDGAYSTDSSTVGLVYSQKYLSHRTLCARQDQCHRLRNHIDVKLRIFFVLRVLMRTRKFLASTHTRICLANALFLLINRRL